MSSKKKKHLVLWEEQLALGCSTVRQERMAHLGLVHTFRLSRNKVVEHSLLTQSGRLAGREFTRPAAG